MQTAPRGGQTEVAKRVNPPSRPISKNEESPPSPVLVGGRDSPPSPSGASAPVEAVRGGCSPSQSVSSKKGKPLPQPVSVGEGSSPLQSGVSAPVVVENSPSSQSEFSDTGGPGSPSLLSGSLDSDTVSGVETPITFSYSLPPASCLGCKKVTGPFKGDSQWKCFHCELDAQAALV